MKIDTPSGEAARDLRWAEEAAFSIFLVTSKRRGDQPTQEWLDHISAIIERHCPSPDTDVDRQCTCHPDDLPPRPCPKKYALNECIAAAAEARARVRNWIEREFGGHGVAIRKETDRPILGEPFMSMATAKELTRRAIAEFAPAFAPTSNPSPDIAGMRKALDDLQKAEAEYRKQHDLGIADATGRAWDRMRLAGDRAREALANNERKPE